MSSVLVIIDAYKLLQRCHLNVKCFPWDIAHHLAALWSWFNDVRIECISGLFDQASRASEPSLVIAAMSLQRQPTKLSAGLDQDVASLENVLEHIMGKRGTRDLSGVLKDCLHVDLHWCNMRYLQHIWINIWVTSGCITLHTYAICMLAWITKLQCVGREGQCFSRKWSRAPRGRRRRESTCWRTLTTSVSGSSHRLELVHPAYACQCTCTQMHILMYAPRRLDACRISWWNIQLHVHTPRASCSFQLHWATLVIACVHQGHQQQQQPRRYVIALEVVIIGVTGEVRGSACGWHMRCSLRCSLTEISPKLHHLSGTIWV